MEMSCVRYRKSDCLVVSHFSFVFRQIETSKSDAIASIISSYALARPAQDP
jgi:hypothetical protein